MGAGTALAVLVCIVAGIGGGVQAAVMGKFGERIGVVEAVAFSSVVTTSVAFASVLVYRQTLSGVADGLRAPPWLWIGGVMSALIVFAIALAPPRIGTTTTVALVIAGNLVGAVVIDRYGLFGLERIGLTWTRVVGVLLLAVGAALTLRRA
ncbi:MAG: DMT family transporter [Actinomycetota bacterium]|nr:DMT family transporter [Actinomycetota bacterium]